MTHSDKPAYEFFLHAKNLSKEELVSLLKEVPEKELKEWMEGYAQEDEFELCQLIKSIFNEK